MLSSERGREEAEGMVAEWVPCSSGFIEADVIRWSEDVWQKPRRRRGRTVNVGDRVVIAEVIQRLPPSSERKPLGAGTPDSSPLRQQHRFERMVSMANIEDNGSQVEIL